MSDIDIKRISYLAKLKLPSEKEEFYSQSLEDIIQWVDNLKKIETSTYMNCGDWVESCTALIEDESGDFKIIKWADEQREKIKLLKAS